VDLFGFALAVLVIELTPGPNMAWLSGLAATEGRRAGMSAVAGVALGLLVNGVLAALGLAALLKAVPQLWSGLQWAGALMMAVLAIEAWRGSSRQEPRLAQNGLHRRAFVTGALINLLNPKAYIFFLVVAPQFLGGEVLSLANAITLAVVSTVIATVIHIALVLAGARAYGWLADPRRTLWARRGFAMIMLVVAASFLLADIG
jgi:threonine/homoserine/homoserine lactone efflux protein